MQTSSNQIVAYYRVSTKRQSWGIDAQRNAVRQYAETNGLTIVEEISEKESGRECERPGLSLAIATARKHRATLVAAKCDRISRDLSYCAYVFFRSGIEVYALNLPDNARRDPLVFAVFAGLAQQEADLISQRTKDGLAAVKQAYRAKAIAYLAAEGHSADDITEEMIAATQTEKGWKLGKPGATISEEMRISAAQARREQADANPANIRAAEELRRYFACNKRNLSAAARHLNDKQIYTSRGVFHDAKSVMLLVARYAI